MAGGTTQSVSSLSAGDSEILRLESTKLDPSLDNHIYTMYRPNKHMHLVERFNDLYEKEWSGAFQELSVVLGEKQAARHLLWVIAKASIGCRAHAAQQLEDLEKSVIGIMVSEDPLHKKPTPLKPLSGKSGIAVNRARNLLLKYRDALARLSIPMLQKGMRDAIGAELNTTLPRRFTGLSHSFVEYAEVCTEVIWLMYVNVPPLCLEWLTQEQEGAQFETDLYRAFTRPGTKYDYCVWPVVRLHQGGPVLVKGFAEGR